MIALPISQQDIKDFRLLRKRLEALLREKDLRTLTKIDKALGYGVPIVPSAQSIKKITQQDRVNKYLQKVGK